MKKMMMCLIAVMMMCLLCSVCMAEETAQTASETLFTIDLTGIILSVLGLIFNALLAVVCKTVIPRVREWLVARTNIEQRRIMWDVVVKTVEAAEQIIGKGKGHEKLEYVRNVLYAKGYKIDSDMIEAAVKEMNGKALNVLESIVSEAKETDGTET